MKRILINGLVLVVLVCAAAWVGYSIGHRRGFELGLIPDQRITFVVSFSALQKLRAGDIEGGTREVERVCFSAAETVYSGRPETRLVASTFFGDFRHYRQTYRTNSAAWTPIEQQLEKTLADWK
jgi:hypothetical protein